MQDSLYPLSAKDIEAIGKSRTNQTMPRNLKIWMWTSMGACLVGIYYAYVVSQMVGIVIMVAGCVSLLFYSNNIDKKRKAMVRRLRREWKEKLETERDSG